MIYYISNSKENAIDIISKEINNTRYYKDGYKIDGDIKGDNIQLKLVDDYNRSSAFLNHCFYGKFTEQNGALVIKGSYRPSNYALILLMLLFVVALESLIFAIITTGFMSSGIVFPLIVLLAELFYFYIAKRTSIKTSELIDCFLKSI